MDDGMDQMLDGFFVKGKVPADEGWVQVPAYDAWTHPETGCVVSGHQMRLAVWTGYVPRSQMTHDVPWL